ncbi:tetratricopeptide repeat protein [bacterium]|nr:tetratricopeptide repeat protein [bacterium]
MTRLRSCWLLLALALAPLAAHAATDAEIARAVRDLGAADYATREAASQSLWVAGPAARPALERANRSPDPEVADRARRLLIKLRHGITPDTPPTVAALLEHYSTTDVGGRRDVIAQLAKLGDEARPTLERLAAEEPDLTTRFEVFQPVLGPLTREVEATLQVDKPAAPQLQSVLAAFHTWNTYFPEDPAPALTVVPWLERVGQPAEAEAVFTSAWSRLEEVLRRQPDNAEAHNNLAWLGVRLRRRLDEALAHAQQAVRGAPDQAAFLDTLAEVQFQRGHREQAVATIKQAVAKEPEIPYFRLQQARIEKGDPKIPPPAIE